MYVDARGGGHWVHFDEARTLYRLVREGWDLHDYEGNYTELGRLRNVNECEIATRWPEIAALLRAAAPLQVESTKPEAMSKHRRLDEIPNTQAGDLFILRNPYNRDVVMYFTAPDRALYLGPLGNVGALGLTNAQSHAGNPLSLAGHCSGYQVVAHLRGVEREAFTPERWPETERRLQAVIIPKVGDILTREQVAALPAGAVTQDLDMPGSGALVEQWNGEGRGRVVKVTFRRLGEELDDKWGERPRPARLVALGTPLAGRKALYSALADQGFPPAVEALAGESTSFPAMKGEPLQAAPVEISATGTMVQVGDMVETTEEALTALPVGAVVHLWDPNGWKNAVRCTEEGLRWVPGRNAGDSPATPWNASSRRAVVIALDCHDRDSAVKARDAFLARPYEGRERAAALAATVEAKMLANVKTAFDQVSDAGLVAIGDEVYIDAAPVGAVVTDEPGGPTAVWCVVGPKAARPVNVVSPLAGQLPRGGTAPHRLGRVVALGAPVHRDRQALLHHLAEAGYEPARARLAAQAEAVKNALDRAREEMLDEPAAIEYRQAMSEIKASMKLDLLTETLQIKVPRLPGETDNAYAARAGVLVKPQTAAPVPTPNLADALTPTAEPTWLERAAEALRPVAAELAAEAKTQTRQAIALGGVEIARAAAHRGLAAAVDALAPQHAAKVVQVTQHPMTRWLENAALFLGARAAGKPALAQVGLREVVKAPMEGAAGLLVQAASQVVGAVKGALVAADEAARVEQVAGQPESAQVSAGEVLS